MTISRIQDVKRLKSIAERTFVLPEQTMLTLQEYWTDKLRRPGGEWTLRPHQAFALETLAQVKGGLFPMTVGAGKTLVAMLAYKALGLAPKDVVVLVPPGLDVESIREFESYREHFDIEDHPHYVTYSTLSTRKGVDILTTLAPKLIVADEAHSLKEKSSNRTSRFLKYMMKNPDTMFVGMSATFSAASISDFAHLSALALKGQSPLPLSYPLLQSYSRVLDPNPVDYPQAVDYRYFEEVYGKTENHQLAFGRIFQSSLGVVVTQADSCDQPLRLHKVNKVRGADVVKPALTILSKQLLLPCGQDVDTPAIAADKAAQISQGFYIREIDVNPEYKSVRKKVRQAIAYHVRANVTESMVEEAFRNGTLPCAEPEAWEIWERKYKDVPPPETEVVWITEDILRAALELGGLVWYKHEAVRLKARELGFEAPEPGTRPTSNTAAVSIMSHGTGFNLQAWNRNVVIYCPASGSMWQQMLGRTHRAGQKSPVDVYVFQHTKRLRELFSKAVKSAKFIEETQGLEQKLIKMTNKG